MKIRNEIQIGLVGLITLIVLFAGIKFLKGTEILSSNRIYYAIYDNVTGIHESNYIYINGLKVGYVKAISPMNKLNTKFLVEIAVDKNINIPYDSYLTAFEDGILGGTSLRIDPGKSDKTLASKDTIRVMSEEGMFEGISSQLGPMMTNLSSVIKRIDTLSASLNNTLNYQSQENIRMTLTNINSISKKLDNIALNTDNIINKDKEKLDNIINNVELISANVLNLTDSIDTKLIASTLKDVNASLTNLHSMLRKIETGEGNLGQLLNDTNLYNNISESTKNLNLLIEDVKNNPKKYINVKVF